MSEAWSPVENAFLGKSNRAEKYAGENIPIVEVLNIYELGKLVALEFMDWVVRNPTGVVALPTGRTPEYFIKTMARYKAKWAEADVQEEVRSYGYPHADFPNTSGLTFVMLDEFFPIHPTHRNSFVHYVKEYYIKMLDIRAENVLDFNLLERKVLTEQELSVFSSINVDLSLLSRPAVSPAEEEQKDILTRVQRYCDEFESKVAAVGGIGFFLGGIGPDGHIAFNQEGCSHSSRTRLVPFNYPTAAAAAGDLGGIEIARGKAAMTIGLATIVAKPDARVIIMAAGEGKATVVREAVELEPHNMRPASVLHGKPSARFYLTHGAASLLTARRAERISSVSEELCMGFALKHLSDSFNNACSPNLLEVPADFTIAETLIHRVSLGCGKPVHLLSSSDLTGTGLEAAAAPAWLRDNLKFKVIAACVSRRLREKVEAGLVACSPIGNSIVHTAPHHDDIMLSYHGAMHEMLGRQPCVGANEKVRSAEPKDGAGRVRSGSGSFKPASSNPYGLGEAYNHNVNHFAYLTSGFHSVNDSFLQQKVDGVLASVSSVDMFSTEVPLGTSFLHAAVLSGEITRDYDELMSDFHRAFILRREDKMDQIENIIFLRKIAEVWNLTLTMSYNELSDRLRERVQFLQSSYLDTHEPGDAIPR
jgi:6-phosphogluconolactonase/glucosamine-6-phosphate isomerase/deaminase